MSYSFDIKTLQRRLGPRGVAQLRADLKRSGFVFSEAEIGEQAARAEVMLKAGRPMFDALLEGAHRRKMMEVVKKYPEPPEDWEVLQQDLMRFCLVLSLGKYQAPGEETSAAQQHEYTAEFTVFRYLAAGEREFAVSRGLGEALALTDPGEVLTEELRLPFDCVRLLVPRGLFHTWDPEPGVWDPVHSIFVYRLKRGTRTNLAMFVTSVRLDQSNEATEVRAFLPIRAGEQLQTALDSYASTAIPFVGFQGNMTIAKAATGEQGKAAIARLFGWVANVLLYITAPGSEVEKVPVPAGIRKLRDQARKHPKGSHKEKRARAALRDFETTQAQPNAYKVGASIRIPGMESVGVDERAAALAGGRHYKAAWLQRGHWRNQPHGLGWRSPEGVVACERGHHAVWIKPLVKRRDLGGVLARTYAVSGGELAEKSDPVA